jgi:hypothetical protein
LVRGRAPEGAPGPLEASSESVGEQAEGGSKLLAAGEAVAIVSAGVLVGGGAGMLAGVALGAINPFALGLIGAAAGAVASVPLSRAMLRRPEAGGVRRPWWRRVFGG